MLLLNVMGGSGHVRAELAHLGNSEAGANMERNASQLSKKLGSSLCERGSYPS